MRRLIFLIFAFSFSLVSCNKNSPSAPNTNPPPTVGSLTLKKNSHKITKQDMGIISSLSANSISFDHPISGNFHVGDIILSNGYNSKAPRGFLRRITSISGRRFQTENASLRDAFKEGTLGFSISPSLFKKPNVKGVLEKESSPTSKTYSLDYLIYDSDGNSSTMDDQLKLEGSLKIDGGITGKINFLPFSIKSNFNFSNELDLNLVATGALNYSTQKRIFSVDGTPIVVSGVVITPTLSVSFKPKVSVGAKASTGIKDKIDLNSSLEYEGSWKKTNSFYNVFAAKSVQISLSGNLQGTLYFELTLYLYEIIGPGVNIGPFARLESNINSSPWWTLYAGAQGTLFLRTRGIGFGIPNFELNLFDSEREISHASQGGPGKPSNPSPYDGEGNVSPPVTLSWTCNPPGDHYKLIYTVGLNPTVIKNNLPSPSYFLGNVEGGKRVFWMVRSFNSRGDSTQGEVWYFDTKQEPSHFNYSEFSPPDGSTTSSEDITFRWKTSLPQVSSYDLHFGSYRPSLTTVPNLSVPYFHLGSFFPGGTKVYWYVDAETPGGNLYSSDTLTFTVGKNPSGSLTFTDPRDGQVYNVTVIGQDTIFAENLNYHTNGSRYYNDDSLTYHEYGRLYSWEDAQSACPPGWHLGSYPEWERIINAVGGYHVAGGKLKETGTSHWDPPNTGATNEYGFSALGGGYYFRQYPSTGGFYRIKKVGAFWTSSKSPGSENFAIDVIMDYDSGEILNYTTNGINPSGIFNMESVRPIKNK